MSGTLSNNGATSHWYTGNDTSDLGRWAWTRLSWKDKNITIISAYRPYKSFTGGVHTVYAQHTSRTLTTFFSGSQSSYSNTSKQRRRDHPRDGIKWSSPKVWHNQILLGAEHKRCNSIYISRTKTSSHQYFKSSRVSNRWEMVQHRHYRKIAGYSNFGKEIPSNHRVLLVNFVLKEIFGSSDKIFKRVTLLRASDPRDVIKYIHRTKKYI